MTTETLPLNPLAALALLFPSGFTPVTSPNDPASTLLEFSPKKPTYGYDDDDSEDDDDDHDDEDEELEDDDDEESEDDGDDDVSYDDEDEEDDYDDEEDEEDEDEEDEEDIGYYTRPVNSASRAKFYRGHSGG